MERFIQLFSVCWMINGIWAYTYELTSESPGFFEPCNDDDIKGLTPVTELIDFSHAYATLSVDRETYLINGYMEFKQAPTKGQATKFYAELFEWYRGRWAPTLYSIIRKDLCKTLFSPKEIWYPLLKHIPKEHRICPPQVGSKYPIVNATNQLIVKIPSANMDGRYKLVLKYDLGNYRTCVSAILDMVRI